MPQFIIEAPNGKKYPVTAPEGASEEQARDFVYSQLGIQPPQSIGQQIIGAPGEIIKGFTRSITTDPLSGIASLGYTGARAAGADLQPFEQTGFGKGLAEAQTYLAPDPGLINQFMGGVGSLLGFVPGGLLKGGIKGLTLGAQAMGLGSEEARARAEQAALEGVPVSPEQQFGAQLGGTAIGITELAPIGKLTGPFKAIFGTMSKADAEKYAPGIFNSAKRMLETGGIEGFQEGMANILQDLNAKGIYNPNLSVGESALGDAAMGASVGAFAQGAIELVTRGKRTQQYEALKAQERREEAEKRMREIEENYLAQIQTTKDQLGIQPEVLALPAPQQEIQPFSEIDPLNNPLGKFTQEEVGADNLTAINEARQKKGLAQLDSLSIEDMVDAKTPQGEIDRVLAYKTGYDGTVELAPDDVMNVAQSKNIDTTTQGFNDFLRRTTGIDNLKKMSQPQLFSAFKALDSLNASETLQVLPEGTNATRFTEQQYENAFKALESKMGEESIPLADALREVKKSTGLKSVQDADALIQTAIRNGEIDAVAAPRYDVVDGNGKVIRTYLKRESAEAAAAKEGFSVRESTSINLQYAGKQAEIANAPTIREVNLQTGVEPQAFEIRSPDKVLASVKSEKEAAQKAERMAAVREGNAQRIEKQIQKEQAKIAGNQRRLEQMEAEGEGDTIKFKKLAAELDAQNKQNAEKIAQLEAQAQAARAPLQVVPKGEKPTAKKGFTVESPVGETGALTAPRKELGTFPTREAAEQAAIANMPDDALQSLYDSANAARGVIPKRLANNARKELESRGLSGKSALLRAPTPTGIPVSFKGTREQAEKTLAEAGVFTRQVRDQVKELESRLRPVMDKLGLKNMRLNILRSIESEMGTADGYYFQKLIAISLDAPNPIRTLRHEGIHALKELGAFTPEQWRVLEDRARKEWVEKYKIAQRYRGLDQESILEEAIADAFSDFDQTKPPAGLIGTLFRNIKQFLEALRNAFRGMGFNTADSVFEQVEAGRMTPRDIEATGGMKFSQNFEDSANLTPLDVESAKFYERELEGLIKKVGNRIAGMKSDQTIADVRKAVKKLQSYTAQGLEGKDWYERSAKAVLEAFNGDKVLAEKFFQIIAITSANTEVKANFTGAYKAWSQFAKGQPIKVGVATKNQNIDALLNFGEDWNGRKTNTFYTNLMEAMEGKDSGRSTIDLHMTRMIFDQDAPTDAQYELAENMVRLMASKIGLAPRQVQAASWVTQKAKSLFDYYRRKGWKKKFSDQELRAYVMEMAITDYSHLMKAKVKELPITPELQELSSKIRSRVQNITGEVIPSRESEMSQAEELKFAEKERLTKKILNDKVIQDIAKSLGITSKIRVTVGAGAYAGKVNPNLIVQVINADPEVAAKDTNDLSNAMSYVFKQDASPYFRADPALVKKEQFGYLFKFEKPLTPAKLKKINQILINKFGTITASGFSKVRPNEIVLINFRGQEDSISDRKFVNGIKNVLNEINEINPIQSKEAFGAQSEYPYHGWSADPDGNAIVTRLQNSRPELRNIQRRLNNFRESFVGELRGAIRATGGIPRFSLRPDELAGGPSTSGRVDAGRDGRGRPAGRSLAPLEGAPVIEGATGPDPRLVAVAEKYAADNNIPYRRQAKYVTVDENFAKRIAQAYEEMRHDPYNPRVIAAYDDLIRQTFAQYQALVDAGYEFTFFDSSSDPYEGNPWNAMRDLRANKRMAVYGTYDGYGTSGISSVDLEENPLLADTGLVWQDQYGVPRQVTANDLFRAVHDAFGHGLEGAGFRVRGEENAYQAHARLFTGPALEALTSETRGQNSWLNYGPYGEQNQTAKVFDTVFAEQKIGIMPSWTWTENIVPDEGDAPRYSLKEGITLGERQPGAVTVDAVHYGKEKVFTLSGNKYGTGIKGAEAERLRYATDPRIKRRVYFYAPTEFNRMKAPEGGLGNHVYVQKFDNILPPGKDMARLYREAGRDDNAFESAVVDAGYDGYYVPSMGMMVILNHDVPVEYRGTRQEVAARPEAESIKIGDKRYSLRQTNTPEFKRWFGDSKVVDADGKPLVAYTGTSKDVDFSTFKVPKNGVWFTTDPESASQYALENDSMGLKTDDYRTFREVNTASRVIPAYLNITKPAKLSAEDEKILYNASNYKRVQGQIFDKLRAQGFDGVDMGNGVWVVLKSPTQIKSAIGNRGTFDPTKADIRYSLRQTDTPEFKQWFGKSTLVDEKGKPQIWYHGTARDITEFRPKQANAIFVAPKQKFTEQFGSFSESYIAEEIYDSLPLNEQYKRLMAGLDNAIKKEYLLPSARKQMKESFDELKKAGSLSLQQGEIPNSVQLQVRKEIINSNLMPSRRNTMPLYVRAENPFDYDNPEHIEAVDNEIRNLIYQKYQPKNQQDAYDLLRRDLGYRYLNQLEYGEWETIEQPIVQEAIKNLGFDSFYVNEMDSKNLGIYDPNQIKSAIGNIGAFSRSNNDIRYALALGAIEPQTPVVPDVGGNPDGILGYAPEALGGKPIRMLVGTHNDIEDKGYGANHILNRILKDPKREPEGSEELLEKVAKTAQNTAGQYFRIFKDSASGAYVFYNGRNALITSQRPGEFSVVSMFKQDKPEQRWGRPIWTGKAPSMPAAFTRPVRGRTVLGEDGRVVPVPVKSIEQKKRIAITPSMVTAAMDEVEAPQVKGTLGLKKKLSIREQMDPATVDAIERTTTSRQERGLAERMAEAISPTAFAKFRQGMINKYESIERLSGAVAKQYGDNELLADQSAIAAALFSDRAAGVAASSFRNGVPIYKNGFTTVSDFDGQVKGLIPILEPLMQRNDPFVFQAFQFYAATRRGKRLTAEGREKLFTADDLRRGAALESQFPEFKQVFDEYQKYNKGLVDYMKDTGVLSDKEAEIWTQNWDYIPFYRQMDGESTVGPNVFSAISGVSKPKKLKGGEEALADFVETVVRNSRAAIEAGMKNVAAQRVARDIVRIGQGQQVPASVARGNDIMTVKENGKTVYYQVDDPLLVESVKSLNLPNLPFLDLLSMPTRALRELVTKDPGFMLANLMRDSLQAWVTTGVSMKPIADTFKQYGKTLAGMSPEAKALAQAGLFTGYDFAGDVRGTAESVQKELRRRAGVVSPTEMAMWPITKVWDALDKGSTASDVATRAEVYKRTLEETGNEAEAMYQAMEVMNFSRKGNSALIRVLTSLVPFMNARIQGLDVLYRAAFGRMPSRIRERQQKAFITRSMTIMAMSMMYWMLASDEEEYKNAEQEVRDNYWIIGNVRIPIPFEIGTLFKVFPERILEYTFGQDTGKDLKDSIVRNLTSTLAVNPIPQAFLPALENLANYSVFTGQPIVGMGMRDVAAPYQATPSTSLLAQEVGEMFNYSPMKVDNLIRGYTGTIGTYAVMAIDSIMRNEGHPTKAAMGIEQTPVLKRFFASDLGTGNISAYYDMKQKVEEATRTINFLERTGNLQDLQEYMQGKGAKMLALKPYVSVLEKDMTMIRDTRRAIQASKMDPDQKREVLDNLRRAENALTSRIRYVQKSMSQS